MLEDDGLWSGIWYLADSVLKAALSAAVSRASESRCPSCPQCPTCPGLDPSTCVEVCRAAQELHLSGVLVLQLTGGIVVLAFFLGLLIGSTCFRGARPPADVRAAPLARRRLQVRSGGPGLVEEF